MASVAEDTPILSSGPEAEEQETRPLSRGCFGPLTVEPVVAFYMLSYQAIVLVNSEYFVYYYNEHDIHLNATDSSVNKTQKVSLEQKVDPAEAAASFASTLMLIAYIPALLVAYLMASYSDTAGRKLVALIPIVGLTLVTIIEILLIHFAEGVGWFYLAAALVGVTGGPGAVVAIAMAYITDVTNTQRRTARMLYVSLTDIAAGGIGQVIVSLLIPNIGFIYTLVFVVGVGVCNLAYVLIFLKESLPTHTNHKSLFSFKSLQKFLKLLTGNNEDHRRLKIAVYSYLIVLEAACTFGANVVLTMFLINPPVSFISENIGYYLLEWSLLKVVAIVLLTCGQERQHARSLLMLGVISGILWTTGLSPPYYELIYIYFVPILGMFVCIKIPTCRSMMTSLVSPLDQGAMSGYASFLTVLGDLLGAWAFTQIYSLTYDLYVATIFCVCLGLYIIALLLLLWLIVAATSFDAEPVYEGSLATAAPAKKDPHPAPAAQPTSENNTNTSTRPSLKNYKNMK